MSPAIELSPGLAGAGSSYVGFFSTPGKTSLPCFVVHGTGYTSERHPIPCVAVVGGIMIKMDSLRLLGRFLYDQLRN